MATYMRGRVRPANLQDLLNLSDSAHGRRLRRLPQALATTWDCRTLGLVGPVQDQGQCGSCWDFSGTDICTSALYKAGILVNDGTQANYLCQQFVLDCGKNGGCNGDDNTSVTQQCQATGLPTQAAYGAYQASPERCKSTAATTLYKIATWGFCTGDGQEGIAKTQDIKNCMVQYGPIGTGVAAGSDWDNLQPGGIITGRSSDINHDVVIVGWDDSKGNGGAWLMRNSWGTSWADGGYAWVQYGADSIGSEAIWAAGPPPAVVNWVLG